MNKTLDLPLPQFTLKEVLGYIKPIGLQILKWAKCHRKNPYLAIKLPNCFSWTPYGTIDKKKTVEALIRDENISVVERYKLACIYCLANDIEVLWNKMPNSHRKLFFDETGPKYYQQDKLVVFWTYIMKGEMTRLTDFVEREFVSDTVRVTPFYLLPFPDERGVLKFTHYQYALEYAASTGNKAATVYFLEQLTPDRREQFLVKCAKAAINKRHNLFGNGTEFPAEEEDDIFTPMTDYPEEINTLITTTRTTFDYSEEGIISDFPEERYSLSPRLLTDEDFRPINYVLEGERSVRPNNRSNIYNRVDGNDDDFFGPIANVLEEERPVSPNNGSDDDFFEEDEADDSPEEEYYVIPKRKETIEFPKDDYTDVFCFLLSQMNKEQQVEVFESCPHKILVSFLDWPWQCIFMEVSNRMWTSLRKVDFDYLLCFIVNNKIMTDSTDFNYQKLFCEFWKQSPGSHKRYVIEQCARGSVLRENLSLILKNAFPAM